MLFNRLLFTVIILLSFGLVGVNAQEAIPASGGDASGSGGSVSYSVGQTLYSTNTGGDGSLVQGVQHPYEIFVVTETNVNSVLFYEISVYPNPSVDHLIVKTNKHSLTDKKFYYQLFNQKGILIKKKNIMGDKTIINMNSLAPAIYFLEVYQIDKDRTNPRIKTFKIIKK